MRTNKVLINTNNQFQNLGQPNFDQVSENSPNRPYPTIAEMNRIVTGGGQVTGSDDDREAPFGEHIREAVTTLRKVLK